MVFVDVPWGAGSRECEKAPSWWRLVADDKSTLCVNAKRKRSSALLCSGLLSDCNCARMFTKTTMGKMKELDCGSARHWRFAHLLAGLS